MLKRLFAAAALLLGSADVMAMPVNYSLSFAYDQGRDSDGNVLPYPLDSGRFHFRVQLDPDNPDISSRIVDDIGGPNNLAVLEYGEFDTRIHRVDLIPSFNLLQLVGYKDDLLSCTPGSGPFPNACISVREAFLPNGEFNPHPYITAYLTWKAKGALPIGLDGLQTYANVTISPVETPEPDDLALMLAGGAAALAAAALRRAEPDPA